MRFKAYKLSENWPDDVIAANKYNDFLKAIFSTNITPLYYSIKRCRQLTTADGTMLYLHLNTDISDPSKDVIAEAFINTSFLYFYQNKYWRIAIDKKRQLLYRPRIPKFDENMLNTNSSLHLQMVHYTTKVLVVYAI